MRVRVCARLKQSLHMPIIRHIDIEPVSCVTRVGSVGMSARREQI